MRSIIAGFLNNSLSRRGFIKNMVASGITLSSARSMMNSLEDLKEDIILEEGEYRTVTGSGGDLLVQQMKEAGIKYVFTNTGSYEVGFFDALIKEPDIQLFLGLHEGIVVSMADGYHRITNNPAFVNVHVIAGTAQMAGQLYNAHKDDSSLVVTAGLLDNEVFSDDIFLGASAGFNQKDINRQFTKISWEVKEPLSIPVSTRRAFKVAATQPGGPVYIAYANYALEAKNISGKIVPGKNFMIDSPVKASPELIEETAQSLLDAKNPVFIFGDEIWKSGAQNEAVELAEMLAIPAATTRAAFRNFPTQHPLYIGNYSPNMSVLGNNVDVTITFGTKDFGWNNMPGEYDSARLIRCGINTSNIGRTYPFDKAVVGDVKEILKDLIDCIKGIITESRLKSIHNLRYPDVKNFTRDKNSRYIKNIRRNFGRVPIHPDELGYVMSTVLGSNAVIVSENFGGRYDVFNFGLRKDETMWMFNTGFSLGWGVGAAMGVQLGAPNRQVVLSIGDGSVMYSASGFWTQARYGIPVLTVVWNNKNYQTVRRSFHRYGGAMIEDGKYPGIYLGDPDINFVKLAESQGVEGEKVISPEEIEPALKRGIQKTKDGKPYIIDVEVARVGPGAESTWYQKFNLADKRRKKI